MKQHSSTVWLAAFLWIGFQLSLIMSANGRERWVIFPNRADDSGNTARSLFMKTLNSQIEPKSAYIDIAQSASLKNAPAETKGKNVTQMSQDELRRSFPDQLSSVRFSENQDQLGDLLGKAGEKVVGFFHNFVNTSAKERVTLFRYPKQDTIVRHNVFINHDEEFQYLILTGSENAEAVWTEYRTDKKNQPFNPKEIPGYIMSSGYAAYCLYLHPNHQPNSTFRYLGRENGKSGAYVIAFAQKAESLDYLAKYQESSTETRFLVHGFIWLDPDSYQVLRMHTLMLLSEKETLLEGSTTDITYEKVDFDNTLQDFWLPKEVNFDWDLPDFWFTSRYKYSDYRLFSVESNYEITHPKADK